MKLHIIIAGWIYACKKPWENIARLQRMTNATIVAFVDNPALLRMYQRVVRPELLVNMSHSHMQAEIRRIIPWIHKRGNDLHFLHDERCCHAPYILYRRYEAMKRLVALRGTGDRESERVLVVRPDSVFDPNVLLAELRDETKAVTHATAFSTQRNGYACPQSINDQWFFCPFDDVRTVLLAFENLTIWHKQWEHDPHYAQWWNNNNRVPADKFFLNTEGIMGKMLQQTNRTCTAARHVTVTIKKSCVQ